MDTFDQILKWRLKRGSHAFPGRDGGTCINEAAIVAAGFPYQPVRSTGDMPSCFSRPICRLAMQLNDEASDVERQDLLPFVTRLACADTPETERERETYIMTHMSRRLPFHDCLKVLDGALAIGRQADKPLDEEGISRMEAIRTSAQSPTSGLDDSLLASFEGWFAGVV
jgi:hypothetical protein